MNRYAHAIYCDDIRQELGGKITLVGIYTGKCLIQTIPGILPKLCISISMAAPKTDPFRSIQVSAVFAGTEVVKMELDESQIHHILEANPSIEPKERKAMTLVLMGVISPFSVPSAGRLKVTVTADGRDLYCEHLEIDSAPPETHMFL